MEPVPPWSTIGSEPRIGSVRRSVALFALAAALVVASLVPIARCLGFVVGRLRYPFDLDWMESGVVTNVQVILSGKQVYRAPSLELTSYVYPPLYYYASAAVSWVIGLGHVGPRLVSVVSIVACFVLLARWVQELTGDVLAGFAASAVFSATYGLTEFWFDLARVDSFFLVQLLGGIYLLRSARTARRVALASAVLATSCFTKQIGFPFAAAALGWLLLCGPRRLALVGVGVYGAITGALFALFAVTSHGWFQFYVFEVPSHHQVAWDTWMTGASEYLWGPVAPLAMAQAAFVCRVGVRRTPLRDWLLQSGLAVVAAATSLVASLHVGGYANVFIPTYALFAVAFGVELAALRASRSFDPGVQVFGLVALTGQCALLWYPGGSSPPDIATLIRPPVPTAIDVAVGEKAVEAIRRLPRPLWVTSSSDLSRVAGQTDLVTHTMGLSDVMKAGGPQAFALHALLQQAFVSHRFKTIVLDRAGGFLPLDLLDDIKRNYRPAGTVLRGAPDNAFWTRSGAWLRPDEIWVSP